LQDGFDKQVAEIQISFDQQINEVRESSQSIITELKQSNITLNNMHNKYKDTFHESVNKSMNLNQSGQSFSQKEFN